VGDGFVLFALPAFPPSVPFFFFYPKWGGGGPLGRSPRSATAKVILLNTILISKQGPVIKEYSL